MLNFYEQRYDSSNNYILIINQMKLVIKLPNDKLIFIGLLGFVNLVAPQLKDK